MARRKQPTQPTAAAAEPPASFPDEQVVFGSSLSLHELFQQQAMAMLESSDLSEEQKQEALVAMACPCCGVGAMSYTVKLRR